MKTNKTKTMAKKERILSEREWRKVKQMSETLSTYFDEMLPNTPRSLIYVALLRTMASLIVEGYENEASRREAVEVSYEYLGKFVSLMELKHEKE